MWIETLFGDCKTQGFGVQKSGLVHGARLERLLLGLALAYVLLLSVGRWVVKRGWRRQVDTGGGRRWKVRLFQIGGSWLERRREKRELPTTLFQLYWSAGEAAQERRRERGKGGEGMLARSEARTRARISAIFRGESP